MCRPLPAPIVAIKVAEFAATGRPSIRTFQTLSIGKMEQFGAPGSVGPSGPPRGGSDAGTRLGWGDGDGGPPRDAPLTGATRASTSPMANKAPRRWIVMSGAWLLGGDATTHPVVPRGTPQVRFRLAPHDDERVRCRMP
jgi:hypothetical protein